MDNHISKFYQSFSGTDTIAFLMMPGCVPVVIGSLTTISYSMFRNKKPVINIGRTNINGVTRGSRIFAGTMIFTLINQHWLRELQDQFKDSSIAKGGDYLNIIPELKVDELPPFDIMIVSANEYGSAVAMYIYGIDFTDEAQTISVEDLFTENTFSFIARDISVFRDIIDKRVSHSSPIGTFTSIKRNDAMRTFMFDDEYIDWTAIGNKAKEYRDWYNQTQDLIHREYIEKEYPRDLYWTNSLKHPFVGADVIFVQNALQRRNFYDGDIDGIFSSSMDQAVRNFQSAMGYPITGVVDQRLFIALNSDSIGDGKKLAIGINKNGTNIYSHPYLGSTISGILGYKDSVLYTDIIKVNDNGVERLFIKTNRGYIYVNDIFAYGFNNNTVDFPTLSPNASNDTRYVIMLQNALQSIYNEFQTFRYGVYDADTVRFVVKFQNDYGNAYGIKYIDGTVDPDTWIAIEDVSGGNFGEVANKNFKVNINKLPGDYDIVQIDILGAIRDFYATFETDAKVLTKASVISHFPNGNTKTTTMTIDAVNGTKISMFDLREALYYDVKEGSAPNKADFFIYPYNTDPYKWTLNFIE